MLKLSQRIPVCKSFHDVIQQSKISDLQNLRSEHSRERWKFDRGVQTNSSKVFIRRRQPTSVSNTTLEKRDSTRNPHSQIITCDTYYVDEWIQNSKFHPRRWTLLDRCFSTQVLVFAVNIGSLVAWFCIFSIFGLWFRRFLAIQPQFPKSTPHFVTLQPWNLRYLGIIFSL